MGKSNIIGVSHNAEYDFFNSHLTIIDHSSFFSFNRLINASQLRAGAVLYTGITLDNSDVVYGIMILFDGAKLNYHYVYTEEREKSMPYEYNVVLDDLGRYLINKEDVNVIDLRTGCYVFTR